MNHPLKFIDRVSRPHSGHNDPHGKSVRALSEVSRFPQLRGHPAQSGTASVKGVTDGSVELGVDRGPSTVSWKSDFTTRVTGVRGVRTAYTYRLDGQTLCGQLERLTLR